MVRINKNLLVGLLSLCPSESWGLERKRRHGPVHWEGDWYQDAEDCEGRGDENVSAPTSTEGIPAPAPELAHT